MAAAPVISRAATEAATGDRREIVAFGKAGIDPGRHGRTVITFSQQIPQSRSEAETGDPLQGSDAVRAIDDHPGQPSCLEQTEKVITRGVEDVVASIPRERDPAVRLNLTKLVARDG